MGPAPAAAGLQDRPGNGNSEVEDVTLNGVPYTGALTARDRAVLPARTETAPTQPAPVVVQPTFTG